LNPDAVVSETYLDGQRGTRTIASIIAPEKGTWTISFETPASYRGTAALFALVKHKAA